MKLQQAYLHDEDGQHNGNAGDNVPETHEVPLKREWTVRASSSVGDKDELNAPPDAPIVILGHADGSSKSKDQGHYRSRVGQLPEWYRHTCMHR